MEVLKRVVESEKTERVILGLIILNAITLGMETSASLMAEHGATLHLIDRILLAVFVVELAARMAVRRLAFFRDPWSLFDTAVVAIALLPATGSLSVLRALRVLRVLRLITALPSLKRVVAGLIGAIPGMGSIMLLMSLIYYVFAVMGTKLFGADAPEQFGSLGQTAYTLFQVMTFDDWSNGVVKPLMEKHPYAIGYFVIFILLSAFMMLNLFIGVVVSALDDEKAGDSRHLLHDPAETRAILAELRAIRVRLDAREPAGQDNAARERVNP
ncbi:MAG: ion transporter [Hyphomicrobiales bacterium]|nr:ion transporter [Hyphomicrobiales bacterium]MCA1999039.1 ion transporter [Hyphomicrobiales bacterium]